MHGERLHRPLGRPKFEGSLTEVRYRVIRKATALKFSPLTPVCVSDSRINSNNVLSCFFPAALQNVKTAHPPRSVLWGCWASSCFIDAASWTLLIWTQANSVDFNLLPGFIDHSSQLPSVSQSQGTQSKQLSFSTYKEWSTEETKVLRFSFLLPPEWRKSKISTIV